MTDQFTREDLKQVIFATNEETRGRFVERFATEIEQFTDAIWRVDQRWTEAKQRVRQDDKRSAWVLMFLFNAFNNLLTAFHLLISGFIVPSGNLMRHYAESIATALLCSHRNIEAFDWLEAPTPQQFPVHKSLECAKRVKNRRLLGINDQGWETFFKIIKFYDKYSHPSVLAVASVQHFSIPGGLVVGSDFDAAKVDEYRKEIRLLISACEILITTIERTEQLLIGTCSN